MSLNNFCAAQRKTFDFSPKNIYCLFMETNPCSDEEIDDLVFEYEARMHREMVESLESDAAQEEERELSR